MKTRALLLLLLPVIASATPAYLRRVAEERALLPTRSLVLPTGSMYPYIKGGDHILCAWKPFKNLQVGDLVRFWPAFTDHPVAHRVIAVERAVGRVWTKGDHNESRDTRPVTEEIYLGVWQREGAP